MLQVWWELASVTAPETNGVRDQDGPANHSWAPGRPGYRISSVKDRSLRGSLAMEGADQLNTPASLDRTVLCSCSITYSHRPASHTWKELKELEDHTSWSCALGNRQAVQSTLKAQKAGSAAHLSAGESHSDWPAGPLFPCSPSPSLPSVSTAPGLS